MRALPRHGSHIGRATSPGRRNIAHGEKNSPAATGVRGDVTGTAAT